MLVIIILYAAEVNSGHGASKGCGIKVGIACFWMESKMRLFFKYSQAGVAFLDVLEFVSDLYFCLATPIPIFGKLLEASYIYHVNYSKISKPRCREYLDSHLLNYDLKWKLKTILTLF